MPVDKMKWEITKDKVQVKPISAVVTTMPTKINYWPGETFDPTGMEITITYSNGSTQLFDEFDNFWHWDTEGLRDDSTSIRIEYYYNQHRVACSINITCKAYDYGDGHLNTVSYGYAGLVYVNGSLFTPGTDNFHYGNYRHACYDTFFPAETYTPIVRSDRLYKTSSTQTYNYSIELDPTKEYTITNSVGWGGLSGTQSFSELSLIIDDNYYSLKQAVDNELIKPLVLLCNSSWSNNYVCTNILNIYNNQTAGGTYAYITTVYMTNAGHIYTGFRVTGGNLSTSYDGCHYRIYDIDDARLTLNAY